MSDSEPMYVDCGSHGKRIASVVCCHLLKRAGPPAGFVENVSDPNNLQAWCGRCEEKFKEENERTPAFKEFNAVAIACVVCYEKSRAYHADSVEL